MKMCRAERLCITLGMRLIHDGKNNPGQFKLPPEDVRYYTRLYQGHMDGEFIRTYVRFIYDERTNDVDMEITLNEPELNLVGHEEMKMDGSSILKEEAASAKS